jgi:hypothetical protein
LTLCRGPKLVLLEKLEKMEKMENIFHE